MDKSNDSSPKLRAGAPDFGKALLWPMLSNRARYATTRVAVNRYVENSKIFNHTKS